jgi:hypothetical protein
MGSERGRWGTVWDSVGGWILGGLFILIVLFAWWYNSGGDQANNITKTRNRGVSGERGDPYRDQGGM